MILKKDLKLLEANRLTEQKLETLAHKKINSLISEQSNQSIKFFMINFADLIMINNIKLVSKFKINMR